MVRIPSPTRRNAGRLLVIIGLAAALPLTASHAISYVDVAERAAPPAPLSRVLPIAAATSVEAVQSTSVHAAAGHAIPTLARAATGVKSDRRQDMMLDQDVVTIDGKRKRWEDLTPAEFARVKEAVAKARTSLANTHLDEARLMRDLANVPNKAQVEQIQRELSDAQAHASEALSRERAAGRVGDGLEAAINARLESLRSVDWRALALIDRQKIAADVGGAAQSMERAKTELARMQARIDVDPRR